MTHIERYEAMLAGRGLKIGDQVVCDYRMPYQEQWWVHPFWVGVIEPVSDDPATWNGSNSEAQYCVTCVCVRVRYLPGPTDEVGFTQHDSLGHLTQLNFGEVTESPYFASDAEGQQALYEFACRTAFGDRYKPARKPMVSEDRITDQHSVA